MLDGALHMLRKKITTLCTSLSSMGNNTNLFGFSLSIGSGEVVIPFFII